MEEPIRVRVPGKDEVIGFVESGLGNVRFRVVCEDKNVRVCRIPGRMRRSLYIRPGDVVLVKKWEIQGDERGDIIWKYRNAEINWLREKKYLTLL